MCGICGFTQSKQRNLAIDSLRVMNDTLSHRGPDDEGFYIDEGVGLAQRRLSILDLSPAGHQPMSDSTGALWVVFNGEIYNYLELQNELRQLGFSFNSHCDTEVIIYAYQAWGEKCFERFNGMFAIVLWDKKNNKVILARDRLGKKPLYYYSRNGQFAFASELKAIMKYPLLKKEIDEDSLYMYFIFGNIPSPNTIFKDVYKLEAGHYMVIQDGCVEDHIYWNPINVAREQQYKDISYDEAQNELERLIRSAVEYRLISDVNLGAFLSGGIDSSLIVSMMAAIDKRAVKTFTIGFESTNFNEAEHAKEIAKHLNTEHHELYVSPKDCFDTIMRLPDIYDEPFADSSAIPTFLVSKMTREHVTVALSGDGGDELFCGYEHYRRINRLDRLLHLPHVVKKSVLEVVRPFIGNNRRLRNFTEAILGNGAPGLHEHIMSQWRAKDLSQLFIDKTSSKLILQNSKFRQTHEDVKDMGLLQRLMLVDIKNYLQEDILTKVDRASMATSLEVRAPLLDYRIVEFALRTPLEYKFSDGITKRILKNILYKYVPKELVERPKMGFAIPLSDWLKKDLRHLVDHYLNPTRLKEQGIFEDRIVSTIIAEHMSGRLNNMNMIWSMLMFQMWFDRYMI
ncbi:MAG: asparagine synthase (glutamine-hydrolyzing) [Clostridia bacterium]|nr:asparagine synthase (glutamine-hydrolyzing) [Clostridia bacterium]